MEFRPQPAVRVGGGGVFLGGRKAQCPCHSAPCWIQRLKVSICGRVSFFPDFEGGMSSSRSEVDTRFQSSLLSRSPATTAMRPLSNSENAPSFVSSRRLPFQLLASDP